MHSDIVYYFSKSRFFLLSLFILLFSIGLIYFSLQFYPDAWLYSVLFACPLLLCVYILPEHLRTFYYLIIRKPALILTKDKLIDNFKGKEYKWSEILRIEQEYHQGPAASGYIALYLNNSEDVIQIQDIKLKGKKFDVLRALINFHDKYGKRMEPSNNQRAADKSGSSRDGWPKSPPD